MGKAMKKKIMRKKKIVEEIKGMLKKERKKNKTCRLKIPHPCHNFSNATLLKTSASDDG